MLSLILLLGINSLMIYYAFKKPGLAFSFLFLFATINNIILTKLGLIGLRYGLDFILFAVLLLHLRPDSALLNLKYLYRNPIFWSVVLVIAGMITSLTVIGHVSEAGHHKIYTFIGPVFILFLAAAVMIHSPWQLREMSFGIVILGAVFFTVFYLIQDVSAIQVGNRESIAETAFNSITLARICGLIAVPSIIYSIYAKFGYKRVLSIIISLLSMYWMLVAATRGVILSVGLVLGLYTLFNYKSKKNLPAYTVFVGVIILIVVGYIDISQFGIIDRFMEIARYNSTVKTSTSVRYLGWIYAFQMFTNHPFYGVGASGYADVYGRYPHNMFFELITNFGIFGLLAFVLIGGFGVYYSMKILNSEDFGFEIDSLVLVWLYFFLAVQTSGNIIINRSFWVMSGILISIVRMHKIVETKQEEQQKVTMPSLTTSLNI